jgi:hypothetical protein
MSVPKFKQRRYDARRAEKAARFKKEYKKKYGCDPTEREVEDLFDGHFRRGPHACPYQDRIFENWEWARRKRAAERRASSRAPGPSPIHVDEKTINRIRSLIALERSPNEHEATRAREYVEAALQKYGLTRAQVGEHSTRVDRRHRYSEV